MKDKILIFTDGASRGNPGPGGWGAIIVDNGIVKEIGGGDRVATNNQMEINAVMMALVEIEETKLPIEIYTDSKYLINGITKWVKGWQANNWMTKAKEEVKNQILWAELSDLVLDKNIKWKYVGGHIGIGGNERCDQIASLFADGKEVYLYGGPISKYNVDIYNLNSSLKLETNKKKSSKSSRSKLSAYSYVSSVKGIIKIDKIWADCEARVKGKSGAKFKKATSPEEEKEIIKNFKVKK